MKTKFIPILMSAMFTGYAVNSHAQANQQLSNLTSPTVINQSLQPGTNNSKNLGSSTKQWKYLYLHDRIYLNGILTMHAPGTTNYFNGPDAGNTAVTGVGYNTATGVNALHSLTSGYNNTAIGWSALIGNTTGSDNTASGNAALESNTIGIKNTANGGYAVASNTTGSFNTAHGYDVLRYNTTGSYNTANGNSALLLNTTGSSNTADGMSAGSAITTGIGNTFVGNEANATSGDLNNATALGNGALVSASSTVRIGNNAVTSIGGYVGWSNVSDGRVKKNIKSNVPGLAFINKLNPITYNLDLEAADRITQRPALKTNDGKTVAPEIKDITARKAKEQVVYTGFVAQEVEKAAKELNYDFSGMDAAKNDKDLYGLRYSDFVVPLVKAVQELSKQTQELSATNKELQKQIDELKGVKNAGSQSTAAQQSATKLMLTSASLDQNNPNPFTGATTIRYSLPAGFRTAQIFITDNSGKTIKQVQLNTAGSGTVNIDASTLTAGTYSYSLEVDGKVIENKRMIVTH
jgi:hypothetical protein